MKKKYYQKNNKLSAINSRLKEQICKKNQAIIHVALNKKLIIDISNQKKTPSIVVSTDATNYYNYTVYFFCKSL